jgi:Pectate lyase superfamily protein
VASNYPTSVDSFSTSHTGASSQGTDHAGHHNDLADAVNKIEAELGAAPSFAYATVRARLDIQEFDVKNYGAVGDGVANDTTAIQAAIDAANTAVRSRVKLHAGTYKITAPLTIPAGTGGFTDVGKTTLEGEHRNTTCIQQATANTPVIKPTGAAATYSQSVTIRNLRIEQATQASTTDTQAYGIAFPVEPPAVASWTIERCWINKCYVGIGCNNTSGQSAPWNLRVVDTWITSTRHNAIKLLSPTVAGMPSCEFDHLYVANTGVGSGAGAIVSDGPAFTFTAASVTMTDIDLEGWYNNAITYNGNSQAMTVRGFYIEHHHFDGTSPYGTTPVLFDVASDAIFDGVMISADTTGAIGAYMFGASNANLHLRGAATVLTIGGGGYATAFVASGTSRIFYNGDWRATTGLINVPFDNNTVASNDFLVRGARALTYSATIATDAGVASDKFKIVATNTTAFTISTPTNPSTGKEITYDIKNSSGGTHGVITWGAGFLNGGAGTVGAGAFTGIANGKRRTIRFYYDGTNWIELSRTADQ